MVVVGTQKVNLRRVLDLKLECALEMVGERRAGVVCGHAMADRCSDIAVKAMKRWIVVVSIEVVG